MTASFVKTKKPVTPDIVAKLWNLCNTLKDDGVIYHQYVTELTYILFLKMAKETNTEDQLPDGYRWDDLENASPNDRLDFYKHLLLYLSTHGSSLVQEIYSHANSFIKKSTTLSKIVAEVNRLDWYSAKQEGLGDLYEGLLEKNANEKKSGAGQYFTPRALIDSMVSVMKPSLDDVIQDPAAGTGGFLIAASHYILKYSDSTRWSDVDHDKFRNDTFYGMEHVQDAHRLALMNLVLHGLGSDPHRSGIRYGDTLSPAGETLPKASLILTNPPFGTKKGGGAPTRTDFSFPTGNKPLCFLQHTYLSLKPGGRAAIILPDNVLFEGTIGKQVRTELMNMCNLHTILRLPTGIFYAQGVKTNVLFFTRGSKKKGNTREVWVYDLRTNAPNFGRRTQLSRGYFIDFENAFGQDPLGQPHNLAQRIDSGETGRFRKFSRDWIAERGENLDIAWLKDEGEQIIGGITELEVIAAEAIGELEAAIIELHAIISELKIIK